MWPNQKFPADLITLTEETLNWKLHFLSSITYTPVLVYIPCTLNISLNVTWKKPIESILFTLNYPIEIQSIVLKLLDSL